MKNYSMYEITVPLFVKTLTMLDAQLAKAEAHAAKAKDPNILLQDRLVFDMLPLVRQIQICTDVAKRTAALISGVAIPVFEDTEKTFSEIRLRIQKTLEFLNTIAPESFNGKEEIIMPMSWMPTKGIQALENIPTYIIPNFYFHAVIAYAILRKSGVEIGKNDYLGSLALVDVAEM